MKGDVRPFVSLLEVKEEGLQVTLSVLGAFVPGTGSDPICKGKEERKSVRGKESTGLGVHRDREGLETALAGDETGGVEEEVALSDLECIVVGVAVEEEWLAAASNISTSVLLLVKTLKQAIRNNARGD